MGASWRRARVALAIASVVAALGVGAPALANDFDQFQNARVAYESANYDLAADLFQGLLEDATVDDGRPLVLESRKYLAATYLFLGRPKDAEAQLELLLSAEPEYVLDPLAFPAEFVKTFAKVKLRLDEERQARQEERERASAAQEAKSTAAQAEREAQIKRLVQVASTEHVEEPASRWIAMLPFGIGQFQNDHDGLGLILAVTQGTLLATSIAAYAVHESLRDQEPLASQLDDAETAEAASRYINQVSLALFGVIAVTGVIDAQVRFRPPRSFDRPRRLPPDLRGLQLGLSPGGLSLTGKF